MDRSKKIGDKELNNSCNMSKYFSFDIKQHPKEDEKQPYTWLNPLRFQKDVLFFNGQSLRKVYPFEMFKVFLSSCV